MELNRKQIQNAVKLLKIICNKKKAIDGAIAYNLFKSEDEAVYVCNILEDKGFIKIINVVENDPLYLIDYTSKTCQSLDFLEKNEIKKRINKIDNANQYPYTNAVTSPGVISRISSTLFAVWDKFFRLIIIGVIVLIIGVLIKKGVINIGI